MFVYEVTLKRYLSRQNRLNLIILLVSCLCCVECEAAISDYAHYGGNVTTRNLRFHDFEPRMAAANAEHVSARAASNLNFKRLARGIHFYSTPEDVTMEMEFIVPFLNIPIERSTELTHKLVGNLMNLNTGAWVSAGVIAAAGAAVAGVVKVLMTPNLAYEPGNKKTARAHNSTAEHLFTALSKQFRNDKDEQRDAVSLSNFIDLMQTQLRTNSIDATACIQYLLCHTFTAHATNNSLKATSIPLILDGLLNLNSVRDFVKGTAIEQSMIAAREGAHSCANIARNCKLSKLKLKTITAIFNYLNLI